MNHNQLALILLTIFLLLCWIAPYSFFLLIPLLLFYNKQPQNKRSTYTPPEEPENVKLFAFKQNKYAYQQTIFWNSKRYQVLSRDNYTCQSCGANNTILHVHHLSNYINLGEEPLEALVSVCEPCHTYQHEVHGYPQTYSDYENWNVTLVKRTINEKTKA